MEFRAWDLEDKGMFDVLEINLSGQHVTYFDGAPRDREYPEEIVLMQYTGLKDKNGKEIYEGDILNGDFPDVVFWDNDRGQWGLRNSENPDDTLWEIKRDNNPEIIGNIYENPELLEEK